MKNIINKNSQSETKKSAIKSLFGLIPYVGASLDEIVYERSARIKQNRLNQFTKLLEEYFQQASVKEINLDHLQTEDFSDIFESIIRRVIQTKSEEKINRFKMILINEIENPQSIDFKEYFLDMSLLLSEKQVEILYEYSKIKNGIVNKTNLVLTLERNVKELDKKRKEEWEKKEKNLPNKLKEFCQEYSIVFDQYQANKTELFSLKRKRNPESYCTGDQEFLIRIQDMIGKALINDITYSDDESRGFRFLRFEITELGNEFIKYLKG